jgi:hypothetical protein
MAGSYEHGNEPSSSIKFGKILSSWLIGGFSRRTPFRVVGWSFGQ